MKRIVTFIASITLMASLVLTPVFTFAKEHGKGNKISKEEEKEQRKEEKRQAKFENHQEDSDDDDENEEREEIKGEKNRKSCLKAFGHLIAPGWIKRNGRLSIDDDCKLPFGIAKKFGGGSATTTPPTVDTIPPVISSLKINPRVTSATVRFTTNEKANATVFYSNVNPVNINASSTKSVSYSAFVRDHALILTPLSPSTTYYLVVQSTDMKGNTATSSLKSFITKNSYLGSDTTPPTISNIVSVASTTNVQVAWKTNEYASSRVYYSSLSNVDLNATSTAYVEKTSLDKNHLLNVSNLSASTTYYFMVESLDIWGNLSRSSIFPVKTSEIAPVTDTVVPVLSNVVGIVGTSTITLSWNTNELSTTKVYYATSTPIDINATSTSFINNSALTTSHSAILTGLSTSTPYYVILESKDASGNAGRSSEQSFTTASGI